MSLLDALRKVALSYPEAEEGIACEGTALETRTVRARKKAFVFLGATHVRVKLRESLPEAAALAGKDPDACEAGAHGWVKLTIREGDSTQIELLSRWIDESYRLLAPKALVASLPAHRVADVAPARAARKSASMWGARRR